MKEHVRDVSPLVSGAPWQLQALLSTRPMHVLCEHHFSHSSVADTDGSGFQSANPNSKIYHNFGGSCSWKGEQNLGLQLVFLFPYQGEPRLISSSGRGEECVLLGVWQT